ncbi:MAG: XTP/dITP diphosphatase [Bacillota bacterium]|nr:XTP/dITP diphosphatase [Bacillota bacterium]HHU61094.1 XTP/dITP diphosphatase [Natronincola sp.]
MVSKRLVVASNNLYKIEEIRELVSDLDLEIIGLGELGDFPEVVEDGETFHDNARKKAVEIANHIGELVLADDSGLEVDALGGKPGVHSARYAGEPCDDGRNNKRLLEELGQLEMEKRGAQFRCVMALAIPNDEVKFSEGICRGVIAYEPKGAQGFGYDPLFFVPEYNGTFAELTRETKNKISHRFLAMQGMVKILKDLGLN